MRERGITEVLTHDCHFAQIRIHHSDLTFSPGAIHRAAAQYGRQSMERFSVRFTLISCLMLFSLTAAAQNKVGFADAVLGRWDITVQGADGVSYPSWMEVRLRTEAQLMGSFVGRFGSVRYASSVEYSDGQLTMKIPRQYELKPDVMIFTGRLVGDRLEGTTEDADGKTLKWTAVRAPEQRAAKPVTWGKPIQLFNGKDTSGWRLRNNAHPNCWKVEGGVLTNNMPCSDIISEQKFGDFKLHVEFKVVPQGNSGVYLRGRHEVQIEDTYNRVMDPLRMGAVYGFIKPMSNPSKAPGEWQTFDITLIGSRVTVVLNGETIINNEAIPGITGGALDANEGEPGPIMLQGDHTKVYFRKVELTPAK